MYRVLIADDEVFVRNLLEKNLKHSNLPIEIVASAKDGREGLKKAIEENPDIIITDIAMPFMNGLEMIEQLQSQGLHSKNIIISGYDEFDYARTAIRLGVTNYLLKPFSPGELTAVFEKIIRELDNQSMLNKNLNVLMKQADRNRMFEREHVLRAILEGKEVSKEQLGYLKHNATQESSGCYMTCIMSLKETSWNFRHPEQLEEFLRLIQSGYFSRNLYFYAVGLEPNKAAVCFSAEMKDESCFMEEVIRGIEHCSKSLIQYYDIRLYCSCGRVYHDILNLRDSYQDALLTWQDALNPEKTIHIYGEKSREETDEQKLTEQIKKIKLCIRAAVCKGEEEESLNLLNQLMKFYASMSGKGSGYVLVSVGELIYAILDDMEQSGFERIDPPQIETSNQYTSLLEIREMLEHYIRKCLKEVCRNLNENRAKSAVHMVQSYLESHLNNRELSIEEAAETVHFSVSYLRQIFKEVTKESFNEYLIRKRMEKAGELLQNTSMKVQDIADACGYENQRYFASSFKKFYGCTPTDFKALMEKQRY